MPCRAWIYFVLSGDFTELRWSAPLEIVETRTGEQGHTNSRLQSCKSSFPLKFFFFFFFSPFRHQLRLRVPPACRPTAIMARRPGDKPPPFTPNTRAALGDTHRRVRGGFSAFFARSFVLMCAALSCGYCGAETEFSILEEAQVLADQMKKLSSQELGVFTMQVNVEEE